MVDLQRLKDLAASGSTKAEAARTLGVSRARIQQLAGRHEISFRKTWKHAEDAKTRRGNGTSPKARVVTSTPIGKISHSVAGKVAELLVAADLTARGWQVFLPIYSNRGHDLIAAKGETILTFEVRSATRTASGGIYFNRKADNKSAYYALVVAGEPVTYRPELPSRA